MADNIVLNFDAVDFDAAVDEMDLLVPKYLKALEQLDTVKSLEEIPWYMKNVSQYWERIDKLLRQVGPFEAHLPINQIRKEALQSELQVLERVYLMLNIKIEWVREPISQNLRSAAYLTLARMDAVLSGLGFEKEHQDRFLIETLIKKLS